MRRRAIALLLGCLFTACASVPLPLSVTALTTMQLRERAGLYPPCCELPGASHTAQLAAVKRWADREGIVVTSADLHRRNLRGSTQAGYGGPVVLLDRSLSPNGELFTLLHELGHLYGPQPAIELEREVIAELIAAMVCQRLGLDVWPQATSYLAMRVPDLELQTQTVQRYGARIDTTAEMLTKAAQPKD